MSCSFREATCFHAVTILQHFRNCLNQWSGSSGFCENLGQSWMISFLKGQSPFLQGEKETPPKRTC